MTGAGHGLRSSQEARWRQQVKETAARRRRLKKLDDDVRAKEELERKEALERRRREREESDKYLRHPSSAAPEPNKPILRRGAGVKWVACKKQGQPTSPRTKSKLLQAKLRAHIREQRAKIKQQIKENPVAKGSDSEVGLDWKTARKMAADGLDTLLHDVLQEESTPPEAAVTSSPELAAAVQDLNFLLCEMGPPKHLSNSAVPPEHTIGSCLNNVNALECSNDHSCTGLGLRQRRSQRARHRPVPQMFPDKVGIDVPEISIPDISVVNNDEKPRWACLVESSDRVDSPSANPCSSVSNSPLPQWADLVRARCPTFSEDSPISFPPPSWTGEPSTSTAEYKGQEVSFFVGAVNIPCHQEEATAKLVFNCSNHGQGDLEITKNTILDSSSARASVGDSANSFDFGMAGSGQLTGPCMLAAENHEQNTAGQSDFPTNQPEKAANQQDSCTANSACLQNLQVLPDHDKSYNSQADQLTSGGTQPGQDETSPNGTPSNTWINAECRTMSKSPQNRAAKSPMSTLSWFSPSNTPPGAHQLSSVQHVSEHNAGEKQAVFTSPGSACGKQSQILPTGSGPEVSSHQRPMAAGVVFCSSRDTSDGIEGKMANKGSYAAAAEGARVRAVKGRQERERLAMELAKRRADVASRKAAEDKQKAGDKGPRGHHVRCTSRSTKYAAGNIQQEVAAGAFHKLAKLPGHGVASVLQSCRQDATTVNGQSTSSIGAQPEKTRPVQKQRRWKQSNGRINSWGQEDSSNVKSRQVHLACDAQQLYSDLSNILDGDSTDEDTELPEDWEIQLLKPNSEKQAKIPSQPSNFARSPLAAALLQLVGLPGMHGMDPLTRAVSGRIAKGHQVDVCTGLSIEEEALLNSLRRIDPNLLRKSLKSVGFDLVYDESSLHEKEKSLLKSLEHLNCKLMKLNFSQGEHLQHCVEAIPKQSLSREADERNRVGHAQMHQTFGENHAADAQTRKNSSHPHRDKKSRFCIAETSSSNHHGRDRATQSALQTGDSRSLMPACAWKQKHIPSYNCSASAAPMSQMVHAHAFMGNAPSTSRFQGMYHQVQHETPHALPRHHDGLLHNAPHPLIPNMDNSRHGSAYVKSGGHQNAGIVMNCPSGQAHGIIKCNEHLLSELL